MLIEILQSRRFVENGVNAWSLFPEMKYNGPSAPHWRRMLGPGYNDTGNGTGKRRGERIDGGSRGIGGLWS